MTISIECPGCSKKLQVKVELIGKLVKCPKCGRRIRVGGLVHVGSRPTSNSPSNGDTTRLLDFKAVGAENALREGIAAVSGRIQSGRLLIDPDTCPNLAAEGSLYAYDPDGELPTETPIDRDNHALSALRYLVMGLAKRGPKPKPTDGTGLSESPRQRLWKNEEIWTPL